MGLGNEKKPLAVYISGPITGMEGNNREAFAKAEAGLVQAGYEAINPEKECRQRGLADGTYEECLSCVLLEMITRAHCVFLLPGWEGSRGARLEKAIADMLGIPVERMEEGKAGISGKAEAEAEAWKGSLLAKSLSLVRGMLAIPGSEVKRA